MDNGENRLLCLAIELTNKVTELYKYLVDKGDKIFSDRLLRSGIEVGVRIFDAQRATGFISFLDRLEVALLYCNDTLYWLNILLINKLISCEQFCPIELLCKEISCILTGKIMLLKAMR